MAGQFCFGGEVRRGVDVGVGEGAGGGLVGCVGGVLIVVDGDVSDHDAVEDASFGWFALVVEFGYLARRFVRAHRPVPGLIRPVGGVM